MKKEILFIHVARVIACLMVVCLHCLPKVPLLDLDSKFSLIVILITRPCVPIFFMITGVLLLPFRGGDISTFYKTKISRIVFPLLFWGVVYSIIPYVLGLENVDEMWSNIYSLVLNYPKNIGGILWYLYILIGLYLIIPFINPEVFKQRQFIKFYLGIWLIACLCIFIKIYYPFILGMHLASSFDMLHYFSGYLGYLFLGHYLTNDNSLETKIQNNKLRYYLLFTAIMVVCMLVIAVVMKISIASNNLPLTLSIDSFLSLPVIIMSGCCFLMIKHYEVNTNGNLYKVIKHLSPYTLGIYLSHMVIFHFFTIKFYNTSTSPLMQISVMLSTFGGAYLLTLLLSKFYYSKYIIG